MVALAGVDLGSGTPWPRIELPMTADVTTLVSGVVIDGVVLVQWTNTATEVVVVDPGSGARRLVTTLPKLTEVVVPGVRT